MGLFRRRRKSKDPRVCLIGLDCTPHSLLVRMIDEGVMPNVAELSRNGSLRWWKRTTRLSGLSIMLSGISKPFAASSSGHFDRGIEMKADRDACIVSGVTCLGSAASSTDRTGITSGFVASRS